MRAVVAQGGGGRGRSQFFPGLNGDKICVQRE